MGYREGIGGFWQAHLRRHRSGEGEAYPLQDHRGAGRILIVVVLWRDGVWEGRYGKS